jgi:hypothetical protein
MYDKILTIADYEYNISIIPIFLRSCEVYSIQR